MPFVPAHEAHAIDRVSATIALAGPSVQSDDWLKVVLATAEVGRTRNFSRFVEGVGAGFSVVPSEPGGWPIEARTQMVSVGVGFQRVGTDGKPLVDFLAHRNEVRVTLHAYVRWQGFLALVMDSALTLLSAYPRTSSVGQIKLEYWDRFISADDQSSWTDVFRTDGRLAPWTTASTDHWHSHMGWFDVQDRRKRLVNLHIDTVDEQGINESQRTARIYTSTSTMNESFSLDQAAAQLEGHMRELHKLSKAAIGGVLSKNMQERISLFANPESTQ